MKGLYIHIPYCNHICNYCDFCKRVSYNEKNINKYIDVLLEEIDLCKKYFSSVETVYIGGGTPNVLNIKNLEKIFKKIDSLNLNIQEYTIEINPELLTIDQVLLFNKYNINRVSIGAQSFNNEDLIYLGRHHTKKDIINCVNLLRDNNITNINIDIIYGHPNDTILKLKENLLYIKSLKIPHVSFYSLILEENTTYYYRWLKNEFKPLSDDIVADMMELIEEELKNDFYNHYEISNYSKKGYEGKHNLIYWNSYEYIGVGLGASGYLDNFRYENTTNLSEYLNKNFKKNTTLITEEEKKKEFFILGLRILNGISINDYKNRFNTNPFEDFNLKKYLDLELLILKDDIIKLSHKGYMLSNMVLEEFI